MKTKIALTWLYVLLVWLGSNALWIAIAYPMILLGWFEDELFLVLFVVATFWLSFLWTTILMEKGYDRIDRLKKKQKRKLYYGGVSAYECNL